MSGAKLPTSSAARHRLFALGLLCVTLAGAAGRLVLLDSAPPALHFDEAVYGLMARQIGPGYWPVFFSGYTGREPLYMYLMAGIFALFGSTAVTLRLTSALIGIASVPALYLLGRELYGRRAGLLAAAVMAGNYWHLSMSRNGYPNILIPPLECLAVTFLWRGYRDRRLGYMALAGLCVGLVLYTYLAARLFPVTLVFFALYILAVDRQRAKSRLGGAALAVLVAALVFAPLGFHFLQHPADFVERASQVLVFESEGGWAAWLRTMSMNLVQNLGGLFVRGDPRPMFNLPGKPIFTPVMAIFFLIGLVRVFRQPRRVEYGLLPIWVLGMCLPAVLTDDIMPQSQRMTGIMPAIYLLAALGLERAHAWISAHAQGRQHVATIAVAMVLALEGAWAARTYFGVWARLPENYYRFHAPYQIAAADARAALDAGDTVIVIAEHYRHPTAVFLEPRMHDALWLVQNRTIVIPSRAGAETVVYWPRDLGVSQPYIEARLPVVAELERRVLDPAGEVGLEIYRLREEVVQALRDSPAIASVGEIEVLGWASAGSAPRDEPLAVELTWRVSKTTSDGRVFSVHLLDEAGRLWSEHTDLGFMPEQWQPGDTVYQLFEVPLPEGIPAGTYRLAFVVADSAAVPFPVSAQGKSAGFAVDLGRVELTAEGPTVREAQQGTLFGDDLAVIAHQSLDGQELVSPELELDVTWQALRAPAEDHVVTLQLADAAGHPVYSETLPLAGQHATSAWVAGEVVHAYYRLQLPDLPAGRYDVLLSVPGLYGSLSLGGVVASTSLRNYVVPEMEHNSGVHFGEGVELLGYDLSSVHARPGDSLALTLYWRANLEPLPDAKVFVHLVDPTGAVIAQVDAVPVHWQRPTSGWRAGEVITDGYQLSVPADAVDGEYMLYVGLYDPMTLARWAASDVGGRPLLDERMPVGPITIAHP